MRTWLATWLALALIGVGACSKEAAEHSEKPAPAAKGTVRRAAVAGSWYPADGEKLRAMVAGMLKGARTAETGEALPDAPLLALMAPHAGYAYSGATAARSYALLKKGAYSVVVVLGPSHYAGFHGASLPDAAFYETPLGRIEVDRDAVARLLKEPLFQCIPAAHAREHSVEAQLPFLQETLGKFRLVPAVVGQLSGDDYRRVADSLRRCAPPGALFVVSSDFTHYGANFGYEPFRDDVRGNLKKLNDEALGLLAGRDFAGFEKYLERTHNTICGRVPLGVLLQLLPKDAAGRTLGYTTSGDVTGEWGHVVCYAAMAFFGKTPIVPAAAAGGLTAAEKQTLLRLARETLESAVRDAATPRDVERRYDLTPALKADRGAFVTLTIRADLRGCIGYILPRAPLYKTVMENAVNAAFRDPRFRRVQPDELKTIAIEISALSVPHRIASLDEFVVGRDGLIIDKDGRSAVFLPQVAPEQGWDRKQTVEHLCAKAGLPTDAWKEGMTFRVFTAEVFNEGERPAE